MTEEQKQRIELLTTFCGYGNPATAEIFFMGIEEHDTFRCDSNPNPLDSFIEGLNRLSAGSEWTYKIFQGLQLTLRVRRKRCNTKYTKFFSRIK